MGEHYAAVSRVKVSADGRGVVSHAGVGMLAVSGPDSCFFGAVDAGAVPAASAVEVAVSAFADSSPFDVAAENFSVFFGLACRGWSAVAGDHHVLHAEAGELLVDFGFAVAAVGGDCMGCTSGAFLHPLDRGKFQRVGGIALLDGVVEHDAVDVVDDVSAEFRVARARSFRCPLGRCLDRYAIPVGEFLTAQPAHVARLAEDGRAPATQATYRIVAGKLRIKLGWVRIGEATPVRIDSALRSKCAVRVSNPGPAD